MTGLMVVDLALAPDSPSWLAALAAEPALVVLLLAGIVCFVAAVVLLRLRRAVREARARGALADWVLGAEDAMSLALVSAKERLLRVVEQDAENHGARTLLAETLLALDEPAAAHEHYLTLRQAFGVDNKRVGWGIVRALVATGRPADAAERLGAMPRAGEAHETLRERLAVELAAGLPDEAVRTADLLLARRPDAEESPEVRLAAATAYDTLRRVRGKMGDATGAESARRDALVALESLEGAAAGVRRRILALPAAKPAVDTGTAVTIFGAATALSVTDAGARGGHGLLAQLASDVAEAPWVCSTCGVAMSRARPRCPYCASKVAPTLREPLLHGVLGSAAAVSDEVEETEAHVQRLLDRTLASDDAARVELVESGARGVPPTFWRALTDAAARDRLVSVLAEMGGGVLDALLDAYERAKANPTLPVVVRGSAAEIVGRVVRTFGRAELPAFQRRLDTEDRDLRKIVVDFYLGLDDVEELAAVLDRYPPVEVIHRLNATPADRLQLWLQHVPHEGFVAEVLLVNPMFLRDEDMLLAAARASSPDALLKVLARRGSSHDLATFAVNHLDDEVASEVAQTLLRSYELAGANALLAGYLDLDRSGTARALARGLLAALGPVIVPDVCQCLGASPSRLDDEIVALLLALGSEAVSGLHEAYAKRNVLERVGGRLVRRYNHPRNTIVKVLARIGSGGARTALLGLRADETDPNLKLRLDQALQMVARLPELPATPPSDAAARKDEAG